MSDSIFNPNLAGVPDVCAPYVRDVRYCDDVEQVQPGEDLVRQMVFDKHRDARRDAHTESHGALKGFA